MKSRIPGLEKGSEIAIPGIQIRDGPTKLYRHRQAGEKIVEV